METKTTPALQRALDALLEGKPIPEELHATLNEAERAEVAALSATAVLTRAVLHHGEPSPQAEESSLRRVQGTVPTRPALPTEAAPPPRRGLLSRIVSWGRRR